MQDMSHQIKFERLSTIKASTVAETVTDSTDSQGFDSIGFIILCEPDMNFTNSGLTGFPTIGKITFKLEHSDDDVTFSAVGDNDVVGGSTDGVIYLIDGYPQRFFGEGGNPAGRYETPIAGGHYKVSYIGPKRYLRVKYQSEVATQTKVAINVIKGNPNDSNLTKIVPHPSQGEYYEVGLVSIVAGTKLLLGQDTFWIGRIRPGDSVEVEFDEAAYEVGNISAAYPAGTREITFENTSFDVSWGTVDFYVDVQKNGVYVNLGKAVIQDGVLIQMVETTGIPQAISSDDPYYIQYSATDSKYVSEITNVVDDSTIEVATAAATGMRFKNYKIYLG